VPKADILSCGRDSRYSITSSAPASSCGGIASPSVLAVLRLMTSSNLLGCTIGCRPAVAINPKVSCRSAPFQPVSRN
jgi:hypothetical protein